MMHWLTLRFADEQLEKAFALDSLPRVAKQGQIAVWMGIVVYLTHGFVIDQLLQGSEAEGMWALRLTASLVPVLVLLLRPTKWFANHSHFGLSMVGFAAGWGLIAMQMQVSEDAASAFYPLIVEVAFYTYNFVGARFVYALCVDLSLLALYNLVFGVLEPYPRHDLIGHDFFLFSANMIGGTAGYLSERQRRLLFLKSEELNRIQVLLRKNETEQARAVERSRILQDMHDGVGAHIGSAIRQLQSPDHSSSEVLATLRDSMDQLKLTIDAMQLEQGDISTLLATLRYRMDKRLQSANLELVWDMGRLPNLPYLSVDDMRQLQFILMEALSNVMQHSQATVLRVIAHERLSPDGKEPNGVFLGLVDNGVGFNVGACRQSGLAAMQRRAHSIGARLKLESTAGNTSVEVFFPTVPAKIYSADPRTSD